MYLLLLAGATASEHAESLRLSKSSPYSAKDSGGEPVLVDWSDIVLVHKTPCPLLGCPIVAAGFIEV